MTTPLPAHNVPDFFCHDSSLQVNEPLVGTATRADVWFLLEYPGPWGKKAFEESALPASVKAQLSEWLDAIPNARMQLIKQERDHRTNGIAFYVAVARELDPVLYEFHLSDYEDLLALGAPAIVAGAPEYAAFIRREPLFLTCTNGRRDRCCAKFGVALYPAMAAHAGDAVWQSTHLGGHRFAAVSACLPHGVYYGRLAPEDAPTIVETCCAGRIHLPRYRGRACYDKVTQIADHFLRTETGVDDLAAFRWLGSERAGDDKWTVRFASLADGRVHRIQVAGAPTGLQFYESCGAAEPAELVSYRLAAHEAMEAHTA